MPRIEAVEIVGLDTVTSRHPDIDARVGSGGTVLATPCHPETEGYSDLNRADGNLGRYAEASLAIVQYRTEILVVDAVAVEHVSTPAFPANREINREFCKKRGFWHAGEPKYRSNDRELDEYSLFNGTGNYFDGTGNSYARKGNFFAKSPSHHWMTFSVHTAIKPRPARAAAPRCATAQLQASPCSRSGWRR